MAQVPASSGTSILPLALLFLAASAACHRPRGPEWPGGDTTLPPMSCRPARERDLAIAPGRSRFCLIDVGSRNVKLVVASLEERNPLSMKDERQCRVRLQLGEKTFDQGTSTQLPLHSADQNVLVRLMNDYIGLCERDGGRMVGATATEWARRATNQDDIRQAVKKGTGISLDILTGNREGLYGYLSATRGVPGKIVLDFGSRSFQLSYWARGAGTMVTDSVPIGIDEAGDRYFGKASYKTYPAARAAFQNAARTHLSYLFSKIKTERNLGNLGPELFSLGENGDVPLAVGGRLWDAASHRGVDENTYGALLKTRSPGPDPQYGIITARVDTRDLVALSQALAADAALFDELRSDRIKRVYGYKMLAFPALVTMLAEVLGNQTVVLVPQELSDGFIIDKLQR